MEALKAIRLSAFPMALVLPSLALWGQEESERPKDEWHIDDMERMSKEWLASRYGTEGNRPPREVVEQRCREDIRHLFAVLPAQMAFPRVPVEFSDLWKQNASVKSLPDLEWCMTYCWNVAGCKRPFGKEETPPEYGYIWESLSAAWIEVSIRGVTEKDKIDFVVALLTKNKTARVHYNATRQHIVLLGPKARGALYKTLLTGDLDSPVYIYPVIREEGFHPTKDELNRMLKSKDEGVREAVYSYYKYMRPEDEEGQALWLLEIRSDEYDRVYDAFPALSSILACPRVTRERKDYLFERMLGRLTEVERMHERGERLNNDDSCTAGPLLGIVSMALTSFHKAKDYCVSRSGEIERHIEWLETHARKSSLKFYLDSARNHRAMLQGWKSGN
jgi:hypothetical protein